MNTYVLYLLSRMHSDHVSLADGMSLLTRAAAWSASAKWTQTYAGVWTGDDTRTSVVTVNIVTDVFTAVAFTYTRTPMTSLRDSLTHSLLRLTS